MCHPGLKTVLHCSGIAVVDVGFGFFNFLDSSSPLVLHAKCCRFTTCFSSPLPHQIAQELCGSTSFSKIDLFLGISSGVPYPYLSVSSCSLNKNCFMLLGFLTGLDYWILWNFLVLISRTYPILVSLAFDLWITLNKLLSSMVSFSKAWHYCHSIKCSCHGIKIFLQL